MTHKIPLAFTPEERRIFALYSDTLPEQATPAQILQNISDVLDHADELTPDDQEKAYSLVYKGYAYLQQLRAQQPNSSTPPSTALGHVLLADIKQQKRVLYTAQDALQWFEEIPRNYPGVISHGGEKYLVLIPHSIEKKTTQCVLLTKRNNTFVKIIINNNNDNIIEKKFFVSLMMMMKDAILAQEKKPIDPLLRATPEFTLTETMPLYFQQYLADTLPYETVLPSDFIFEGRTIRLILNEEEQDQQFVHVGNYFTPSVGKRHLENITAPSLPAPQTPSEWFSELQRDNPNVLIIDGEKVFISASPNDTYTGLESLAIISPSVNHSDQIQVSITPQLGPDFENRFNMAPHLFVQAIENSLVSKKPLKGKALRIMRDFTREPVKSNFTEAHAFQNIADRITHYMHLDSGYVTDLIFNANPESKVPFTGFNFIPFREFQLKRKTPARPPYAWFSQLTSDLEFVSVVGGQKFAYLVDPRHPKDEALLLYETISKKGSPSLGMHHVSTGISDSAWFLDELYTYFSSGKTKTLSPKSEQTLLQLLSGKTDRNLHQNDNQIQIIHPYGHSFTYVNYDRFVHVQRSDYTGKTQITWFDPFSQTPQFSSGTVHTTLHGSDVESIKDGQRAQDKTHPFDWYKSFTQKHPSVIPVQTNRGTTNMLVLATKQNHKIIPSINIAYEVDGELYLFPLDRNNSFDSTLGTDTIVFYDEIIKHLKESKATPLSQKALATLRRIASTPSKHHMASSKPQITPLKNGHMSFTVALGRISIELATGKSLEIYEAAPFSDYIPITSSGPTITKMQQLSVSFDESKGFENITLYHDPLSEEGIALSFKLDEQGQRTNDIKTVFFFKAPADDIKDLRDLTYYIKDIVSPAQNQSFEEGSTKFHINIFSKTDKTKLGHIGFTSSKPGSLQVQTSTKHLKNKLWHDTNLPYHDLLAILVPGEEYSVTDFQYITYTTTNDTKTEHEIAIPLGLSKIDGKTLPIEATVLFKKNKDGTPEKKVATVSITAENKLTTFLGNIIPYTPEGEHTEGLYLASFNLGDYRFFIGIVLEDLYTPEDKDYFSHTVLKQRITNYDAVMADRDAKLKAEKQKVAAEKKAKKKQEKLETAKKEAKQKQEKLKTAITGFNNLNTQRSRARTISTQISSNTATKSFLSLSSRPVPFQARFNQDRFRNLRILRPGKQTGITIDLKFFHSTTVTFSVTNKEKTGSLNIYRLETPDPSFPGRTVIMTDNGSTCTFDFSHNTQTSAWLESLAFGPKLETRFDKTSGKLYFEITEDPYGSLARKFPLKSLYVGKKLAHLDAALKSIQQAQKAYEESLALYQSAAIDRLSPPLQETKTTKNLRAPLLNTDIKDAPSEVKATIETRHTPEGSVLDKTLTSLIVRGQAHALPLTLNHLPLHINIQRETHEPEGKEQFTVSIPNAHTIKVVGQHRFTPYKKGESVTSLSPEIIHENHIVQDPFEIEITTKTHSQQATQYFASLKPTGFAAELSGINQTKRIPLKPEETEVSFVVPNIGTLTYELTGSSPDNMRAERLSPEFLWDIEKKGEESFTLTIMDVDDNLNTLNFAVVDAGTTNTGPFCIHPDHLDTFAKTMSLHGITIPLPEKAQKQVRIDVTDPEHPEFSLVNITAGIATQHKIIIPQEAKPGLQEAANPANIIAAASPDAVSNDTKLTLVRNIATRENLQFDSHEKFVTGERTVRELLEALKQTPITLSESSPYWYEIRAVNSGIVLRIPFYWHPSDKRNNVLSLDYGRQIQAYIYGDSPENAISLTDDRYRMIQLENGSWNIKFLDVSSGVEFDILTTNKGWFRAAANIKNDSGKITSGIARSKLLREANNHNEKHVANIAKTSVAELPTLVFSSRKQPSKTQTRQNDFRYYNPDGTWIELTGISITGSYESFSFPSMITAHIGTEGSETIQETITLTPPVHKEGLGRHTFCLIEQLPDSTFGRTFYWRPFEAPYFIEATEANTKGEDFDDLLSQIPAQNIFTSQAKLANKHVVAEVDPRIQQIAQHLREYGYPEDKHIKSAKAADPELLRERFDSLHDQIWVPDKESLVTEILTGGDRVTLRFLSREAIIEVPMIMDEVSGQYEADTTRTVLMLLREQEHTESYLRLNLSMNQDEGSQQKGNGSSITQLTTMMGKQALSLDLSCGCFKTAFNRDAFGFRSALPVQRGGKATITNTEVKAAMGLWLSFNGLDKDAEIMKQTNNEPLQTPFGTLDLHVGEKDMRDTTFHFKGIDLIHSGDNEGKALTNLDHSRQLEVSRAANNTSALYVHGLDPNTEKPYMVVAGNKGETCLIPPSPDTARFVFVQELQKFETLNQNLRPYASKVKSSAGIIVEEETSDKIIFSVTFLPGRNQSSSQYKEALKQGVFRKVACHLLYDKKTGTITPEPGARIRIQPKPGDAIEWLDADVTPVLDHKKNLRIYFKGKKGYSWIEFDNFDKLISTDPCENKKVKPTQGMYGFAQHGKPFLMPENSGFLSIFFGMHTYAQDKHKHDKIDSIYQEFFTHILNTTGRSLKKELIKSDQTFSDFDLFASAVTFCGVDKTEERFEAAFNSMIKTVNAFKDTSETQGPTTTKPQPTTPTNTPTTSTETQQARTMPVRRPAINLGRRQAMNIADIRAHDQPLTPQTIETHPARQISRIRPMSPLGPISPITQPASLTGLNVFTQPFTAMPVSTMFFRPI
jgi:hypothetical protein